MSEPSTSMAADQLADMDAYWVNAWASEWDASLDLPAESSSAAAFTCNSVNRLAAHQQAWFDQSGAA